MLQHHQPTRLDETDVGALPLKGPTPPDLAVTYTTVLHNVGLPGANKDCDSVRQPQMPVAQAQGCTHHNRMPRWLQPTGELHMPVLQPSQMTQM